jgi:Methylase involved in ubiquinone/menaquinone biosynthesis
MKQKPDYGVDAPGIIRNLIVIGIFCLAVVSFLYIFLKGHFDLIWLFLTIWVAFIGVCLIGTGLIMILSSKIGKIKERERILDLLQIKDNENILDVGCGSGLYLIGAVKRLSSGKATGIDIWQSEDLSGNHQVNTTKNADIEGVGNKIEVKTADMKRIPFQDNSFDIVLSSLAIHNIYEKSERRKALLEITRVLKAGGKLCIIDMQHIAEYINVLSENGITDIKKYKTKLIFPVATVIMGKKTKLK